jgi:phage terminase small subunit
MRPVNHRSGVTQAPTALVAAPQRQPRHLSAESKALWRSVVREYELEPRHESVLTIACEALDRLREAQAAIAA